MAGAAKDYNLTDKQAMICKVIKDQLYPEETFPRHLFPDLDKILFDHFKDMIKFNVEEQSTLKPGIDKNALEDRIGELLRFETILQKHPQVIILIYRSLIARYIKSKHQIFQEREDILQEIIARLLLNKMPKIQEQYNFKFKNNPNFTSYFMVIVRNIHIDIIRERKNKMLRTVDIDDVRQPLPEPKFELTSNKIFIEEELIKFQLILKMYYKSQPKIELCLKIKFRIPVSTEDIIRCFPNCSQHDIDKLSQDFRFKQDRHVFETIIDIFNRNEGKENKGDTLRKWLAIKTDEIIHHLNHTYDYQVYNQKNISDLITLYFQDMYSNRGDQKWT